ncbi:Protein TIC 20-v [Durusdinium trenchii]|uniref:Chloroplastic n=1 Tax=Durusdinium trenchii TaxID=1381693 RepID=A0ABP0QNK8_9DINO
MARAEAIEVAPSRWRWALLAAGASLVAPGRWSFALPSRQAQEIQRSVERPFVSSPRSQRSVARTAHQEAPSPNSLPAGGIAAVGSVAATGSALLGLRRVFSHRMRQPVQRAQSPFAEVAFGAAIYWTVRAAVHAWVSATDSFALRDDLFQDMAVAHTYKNSIRPWITSGIIALISSVFVVFALKEFIKGMKEWEQQQEMKEMQQMGEDALFLMSTPVDATPLEKKKERMRHGNWPYGQDVAPACWRMCGDMQCLMGFNGFSFLDEEMSLSVELLSGKVCVLDMLPNFLTIWALKEQLKEFHPSQDELTRKLSNVQVVLDGKKLVDMVVVWGVKVGVNR